MVDYIISTNFCDMFFFNHIIGAKYSLALSITNFHHKFD